MTSWEALEQELDRWAERNRRATFWWRDDDAVAPGPELARLLDLAERPHLPLALAVIPEPAEPALADLLDSRGQEVAVLQHGLVHENLAPAGAKRCELVGGPGQVEALAKARGRLEKLFGSYFLPVLVPPWNRIAKDLISALPACGFTGLSTFTPRKIAEAAPGLRQINCHVDLLRWRPEKAFAGEAELLGEICRQLRGRRETLLDGDEPCGILTHHLVHDPACWAFLARLLEVLDGHGGARICAAGEIFSDPNITFAALEKPLRTGSTGR